MDDETKFVVVERSAPDDRCVAYGPYDSEAEASEAKGRMTFSRATRSIDVVALHAEHPYERRD